MKFHHNVYLLLGLLTLLAACQNPEKLLPKDGGTWRITRQTEELYLGAGLVDRHDASDAATLVFGEDGQAVLTDSTGENTFPWTYNSDDETLVLEGLQVRFVLQGAVYVRQSYPFRIRESKRNYQRWRYEETFTTFNPFTQDSSSAQIVVQWELERGN